MSSSQNVAEMLNNIHKELQSLKAIIPNNPIEDDNQFISINNKIGHIGTDINLAKDLISETRQEALQDEKRQIGFEEEKILADADEAAAEAADEAVMKAFEVKQCSLFLSIFPENAIIKRRPLIYWWIGEGLISSEEEGEKIFEELLKLGLTVPYGNSKSPHVNKCKVQLHICHKLIQLAQEANLFKFNSSGTPLFDSESPITPRCACLTESLLQINKESSHENLGTIFNVDKRYVSFDFSLAKFERTKLTVLQLGQWRDYRKHHIELMTDVILKKVEAYKCLKYLGLRGISKLTSLPSFIFNLANLEILDLKACDSLRELPLNISSLKKLTHLDVSDCHLLESMPKGIDKLTFLQVLKGHVIGSSTPTPCKIRLLKNLENLKRLSIYIMKEDMKEGKKFDELKELISVRCLKITWVLEFPQNSIESFSFPPNLEELELEKLPQDSMPEWLNPQTLTSLKKLCIKGGKLSSLNHSGKTADKWNVEFLYLKYLRNLRIGLPYVKKLFPKLKYVQKFYEEGYESQTSHKIRSYGEFEWIDPIEWQRYRQMFVSICKGC